MFRRAILIIHGYAGGTYDEEYLKQLIGSNYEYFKGVFTGNPDSTYLLVKSEKDINDITLDLVKTSNWEVN